jgi:hypothetical protein
VYCHALFRVNWHFPLIFAALPGMLPQSEKLVGIMWGNTTGLPNSQGTSMKIGYARVSTQEQSLALQRDALRKAGCRQIYEEVISGARVERPVLQQMLAHMRAGDVLMIWKLDRLGRSPSSSGI